VSEVMHLSEILGSSITVSDKKDRVSVKYEL